jgi:hypothetical protein
MKVLTLIPNPFKNASRYNDNYDATQLKGLGCSSCITFGLNLQLLKENTNAVKNANLQ